MSKIHVLKYCILRGFVRINKKITGKIQVKYSLVQNKWYNYSITISSTQQYTCTEMNDIGFTLTIYYKFCIYQEHKSLMGDISRFSLKWDKSN